MPPAPEAAKALVLHCHPGLRPSHHTRGIPICSMQAAAAAAALPAPVVGSRQSQLRGLAGCSRPLHPRSARAAPRLPAAQRTIRAVAATKRAADGAAPGARPLKIDITQEEGSTRIVVEGTSRPGEAGVRGGGRADLRLRPCCRCRRCHSAASCQPPPVRPRTPSCRCCAALLQACSAA